MAVAGVATATWLVALSPAAAMETLQLRIENHRFVPEKLSVPANKKFKLVVHNLDSTAEEFESYELNREKIIGGGASGTIYLGPLAPGAYPFFGDFHRDTAQGVLMAE